MTANELEQYLHKHLPISKATNVSAIDISNESVVLSAPLAPNINHCGTVFGGSASTLAILSAWSLLYTRLESAGVKCKLVIQRNTMNYEHPISGAFTTQSSLLHPENWDRFIFMLSRKGKARISVNSELEYDNNVVGHFTGEFVALSS